MTEKTLIEQYNELRSQLLDQEKGAVLMILEQLDSDPIHQFQNLVVEQQKLMFPGEQNHVQAGNIIAVLDGVRAFYQSQALVVAPEPANTGITLPPGGESGQDENAKQEEGNG